MWEEQARTFTSRYLQSLLFEDLLKLNAFISQIRAEHQALGAQCKFRPFCFSCGKPIAIRPKSIVKYKVKVDVRHTQNVLIALPSNTFENVDMIL